MDETELAICRQAYATQMLAKMGIVGDERLRQAFATVPREDFLTHRHGAWQTGPAIRICRRPIPSSFIRMF